MELDDKTNFIQSLHRLLPGPVLPPLRWCKAKELLSWTSPNLKLIVLAMSVLLNLSDIRRMRLPTHPNEHHLLLFKVVNTRSSVPPPIQNQICQLCWNLSPRFRFFILVDVVFRSIFNWIASTVIPIKVKCNILLLWWKKEREEEWRNFSCDSKNQFDSLFF